MLCCVLLCGVVWFGVVVWCCNFLSYLVIVFSCLLIYWLTFAFIMVDFLCLSFLGCCHYLVTVLPSFCRVMYSVSCFLESCLDSLSTRHCPTSRLSCLVSDIYIRVMVLSCILFSWLCLVFVFVSGRSFREHIPWSDVSLLHRHTAVQSGPIHSSPLR